MRKDWQAAAESSDGGAFWDAHWDAAGAPPTVAELRLRDEYRCLQEMVPGFTQGGLDVLDCGCGRGEWMQRLREDGHRPRGVDLARRSVEAAEPSRRAGAAIADFRHLPFGPSRFDLLINWGGIEHDEAGPAAAIREAARVLRPSGHLVVTTPCHNARVRWVDRWKGVPLPPEGGRFYQYRFTPAELKVALEHGGFEAVRTRPIAGMEGMTRSLQQELRFLDARLPARGRWAVVRIGGRVLRPFLGHMVLAVGRKPA